MRSTKNMTRGFSFKGGFNYGESRSLVEPSSTAAQLVGLGVPGIVNDPNNPALAYLAELARQARLLRGELQPPVASGGAATTFSAFYDGHTNGNTSYLFAGDANGDSVTRQRPDLHPARYVGDEFQAADRSAARTYTAGRSGRRVRTADQRRQLPEVAPRPVRRAQRRVPADRQPDRPERHAGHVPQHRAAASTPAQIRLDITNFGNLLNNNWGVGQRLVNNQILTAPTADATGKLSYNLQNAERQPDHVAATDVRPASRTST